MSVKYKKVQSNMKGNSSFGKWYGKAVVSDVKFTPDAGVACARPSRAKKRCRPFTLDRHRLTELAAYPASCRATTKSSMSRRVTASGSSMPRYCKKQTYAPRSRRYADSVLPA